MKRLFLSAMLVGLLTSLACNQKPTAPAKPAEPADLQCHYRVRHFTFDKFCQIPYRMCLSSHPNACSKKTIRLPCRQRVSVCAKTITCLCSKSDNTPPGKKWHTVSIPIRQFRPW